MIFSVVLIKLIYACVLELYLELRNKGYKMRLYAPVFWAPPPPLAAELNRPTTESYFSPKDSVHKQATLL